MTHSDDQILLLPLLNYQVTLAMMALFSLFFLLKNSWNIIVFNMMREHDVCRVRFENRGVVRIKDTIIKNGSRKPAVETVQMRKRQEHKKRKEEKARVNETKYMYIKKRYTLKNVDQQHTHTHTVHKKNKQEKRVRQHNGIIHTSHESQMYKVGTCPVNTRTR